MEGIEFSYRVGFSKITDKVNNDGRETHEVELIFSVVANTSSELFDLDALDATSRVEREFQNQLFGLGDTLERPHYIVNEPQIIDQEHGYFIRTVTIRQYVKIGNPEQETFELGEGGLNVS
nr:hypothetical protein BCU42_14330 [Vibrio splendidus]